MSVKTKTFLKKDIENMDLDVQEFFKSCFEHKTYHLIGINWYDWVKTETDDNGNVTFNWE
jgi:peptide deformylase